MTEPAQLLTAVQQRDSEAVLGVTLSAYPIAPDMTADEFASAMIEYLQQLFILRELSEVGDWQQDVAGLAGAGRLLTYSLRGQKTNTVMLSFVRPVDETFNLCYVLTVEMPADNDEDAQAVLKAVASTVSLQEVQPPSLAPAQELDEPLKIHELGFSISPPKDWFAATMPGGVTMGQVDYTLGGELLPTAQVTITPIDVEDSASTCVATAVDAVMQIAKDAGLDVEVVSQAQAVMAGRPGRQFVIRQKRPAAANGEADRQNDPAAEDKPDTQAEAQVDAVVIVQRVVCVSGDDELGPRSYSLTLVCRSEEVAPVEALMDSLAEGFEVIPVVMNGLGEEDTPSEPPQPGDETPPDPQPE